MTTVASDQLSLHTPSLWTRILEIARGVASAVAAHRRLTPTERHLYDAAEQFGAIVLDASDVADLRARLYAVARDERLLRWEFEALADLGEVEPWPDDQVVEDRFAATFGDSRLTRECARLLAARVRVLDQVFARIDVEEIPTDAGVVLYHALQDFRAPPVLRSLFEETLAGEGAMIALVASLMDPTRWPCEPWLKLALLEQLRLASVSHLRLLSVIPEVQIPDDLLAREERLDTAKLEQESKVLAKFLLPTELRVQPAYVDALVDVLDDSSEPPPGVRALFAD